MRGRKEPLSSRPNFDSPFKPNVRFAPILLKKSFSADGRNFSASLVHPMRGDVRDLIDSHKSDYRPP